ncbi:MAG: thioesterase family protein, partial [Gammaproteobacteria bacterium]
MDWDYPAPFSRDRLIATTDIDGLGHANNTCYVIWCEEVSWQHSAELGLDVSDYRRLNRGMAIHRAQYDYFLPGFEGDPIAIGTWLTWSDGRLRLQRQFQVRHRDSGATLMRGRWLLVCVNLETGKASRFPTPF